MAISVDNYSHLGLRLEKRHSRPLIHILFRSTAMKKSVAFILLVLGAFSYLSALDVDREELLYGLKAKVDFFNYQGPHSKVETRQQIIGIGTELASGFSGTPLSRGYHGRYRIIHAVDPSLQAGFDADIFVIEKDAEVDHINNVRLILLGYLMKMYGYSIEDAAVLAEFVTYYNAAIRSDMDYASKRYKPIVLSQIGAENVGISRSYAEWPGRSRLLIPLSERPEPGNLGALGTDELAGERVLAELREQADMGIQPRKEMTELRERDIEQQQERLQQESEQLAERERRLAEERSELAEQREEIEQRRQEMSRTGGSPQEQAELAAREKEIADREEEIAEEERIIETRREEIGSERAEQGQRQAQVQEERERIAADERTVNEERERRTGETRESSVQESPRDKVYFLHIADIAGEPHGQLLLLDSRTGAILGTSSINTIRNRSYELVENRILVIAGKAEQGRAVRLVLLDPVTLNSVREGGNDIFKDSVLVASGSSIFAVVKDGDAWKVGLFDKDLALKAVSQSAVDPYTSFTLSGSWIYVQDSRGNVVRLMQSTLRE